MNWAVIFYTDPDRDDVGVNLIMHVWPLAVARPFGEQAAGNPQKPAVVLLHCEEHIYSRMTDHSSPVETCAEWLKKRKGHSGIVNLGSFTDTISTMRHTDPCVQCVAFKATEEWPD